MVKAIVLHSGGIDSSVALALAIQDCGKENVLAVSFLYGQKHHREIDAAKDVCFQLGIRHVTRQLNADLFRGSAITEGSEEEVPTGTYAEVQAGREGPISTYVPFRNGQFISAAAAIAVQEKASRIYFGPHLGDHQTWAYPDCSEAFVGAMAAAVYIGTNHRVRLFTPLLFMTKAEVVSKAAELRVPAGLTWSCYRGSELACGTCPTCLDRIAAFRKAGYQDPVQYEIEVDWRGVKEWPTK